MNQYIVTYRIEDKVFVSASDEDGAKKEALDQANIAYDVYDEDVEILEVKLI